MRTEVAWCGVPVQEIEFQLEPADVEAWFLSHIDRNRAYRLSYWACGLVVSGVLAVGTDTMVASLPASAGMALAGFGFGWVLARAATRSHVRLAARDLARAPGAGSQFGTHRLRIDAAGVSEAGPAAQHAHEWKAVLGLTETADHMFLRVAGGSAYIVPRRAFTTTAALDSFRAAVSDRISTTGQPRGPKRDVSVSSD